MKEIGIGILIIFGLAFIILLVAQNVNIRNLFSGTSTSQNIYSGFRRPGGPFRDGLSPSQQIFQQPTTTPATYSPPPPSPSFDVYQAISNFSRSIRSFFTGTSQQPKLSQPGNLSPYAGKIRMVLSNVGATDPQQEFITIQYVGFANDPAVTLTGWSIEGSRGGRFVIPEGARLPMNPGLDTLSPIQLKPGGILMVVTGKSPRNQNFQLNKCIGYFEELTDFFPSLPVICPSPPRQTLPQQVTDACIVFSRGSFGCIAWTNRIGQLPSDVKHDSTCVQWISEHLSYAGCVKDHQQEPDFIINEWRVWLGQTTEIWSHIRDTITLRDAQGKIVETISY